MSLIGTKSEQQNAVYRSQTGLRWGAVVGVEEAQAWVDDKTSRDWWVNNYPHVVRIEVEALHGNVTQVAGVGHGEHHKGKGVIGIPPNGASLVTLLHEMAHCIAPENSGHEKLWARTFLTLTYQALGADRYMELYNAFVGDGVDFG